VNVRPITDQPGVKRNGGRAGHGGTYIMPVKVCATCGGNTDKAKHTDCRRDPRGRLLVLDEVA